MTVDISQPVVIALWEDIAASGLKHHTALYVADIIAALSERLAELESLRDLAKDRLSGAYLVVDGQRADLNEARTQVAALTARLAEVEAERDAAKSAVKQWEDQAKFDRSLADAEYEGGVSEIAALAALLDKAEKALEEFATFGRSDDANLSPADLMRDRICDWFGVSDFDGAASALAEIEAWKGRGEHDEA